MKIKRFTYQNFKSKKIRAIKNKDISLYKKLYNHKRSSNLALVQFITNGKILYLRMYIDFYYKQKTKITFYVRY